MIDIASSHSALDRPSVWVKRFAPVIPEGEVLDLACGSGRHARLLAQLGHPVLAVDRDAAALENACAPGIETRQIDLESGQAWPFEDQRFAAIVVTNYLHRPLFPGIARSLAEGGALLYETFAQGNELYGKPGNPAFLLKRGELLALCASEDFRFQVVAFEEGYVDYPKPAVVQRLFALKGEGSFPRLTK